MQDFSKYGCSGEALGKENKGGGRPLLLLLKWTLYERRGHLYDITGDVAVIEITNAQFLYRRIRACVMLEFSPSGGAAQIHAWEKGGESEKTWRGEGGKAHCPRFL